MLGEFEKRESSGLGECGAMFQHSGTIAANTARPLRVGEWRVPADAGFGAEETGGEVGGVVRTVQRQTGRFQHAGHFVDNGWRSLPNAELAGVRTLRVHVFPAPWTMHFTAARKERTAEVGDTP